MAYLPNKSAQGRPASGWRIGFLVFFVLLIFAGWFYFSDYKNKQARYVAEQEKSPLAVVLDTTSQLDADSDGDGLKDWEELLWKTDSSKPDTDGDGTNDNEEITLNRNPLKAGPNDKISEKEDLVAQEKAASDSKQNTLTAAYARKFLTDYLLLKQQKGVLTAGDKNQLAESFMSDLKPLETEDKYKLSDLKITQDSSKEAIEKYADEMKKIFITQDNILVNEPDAFEGLLKSVKNQNEEETQKYIITLDYSIAVHDELIKNLISVSVPKNFSELHLETINGLNNVKFAIKNMEIVPSDPVKAMMGRKLYDIELRRAYDAINNIQKNFDKYQIYVF